MITEISLKLDPEVQSNQIRINHEANEGERLEGLSINHWLEQESGKRNCLSLSILQTWEQRIVFVRMIV